MNEPLENVVSPPLDGLSPRATPTPRDKPDAEANRRRPTIGGLSVDGAGDVMTLQHELDRTSRQWTTMARAFEQQNDAITMFESSREDELRRFRELVDLVDRAIADLKTATDDYRKGASGPDVETAFDITDSALGDVEKMAGRLAATMRAYRTAWTHYTDVIEDGKRLMATVE